jgi:hypothetical protein
MASHGGQDLTCSSMARFGLDPEGPDLRLEAAESAPDADIP